MDIKLQRVGVVVLVAIVTLGALIGAQIGWKKYMMDNPVISRIQAVQGVSSVQISKDTTETGVIQVKLGNVPNIKQTSQQLLDAAGLAKILLIDNRSPELQALLEKVRFCIEEAIAKGNYTAMAKTVEDDAKAAKLDNYGIYMDSDNIYLQFQKGQNYLYQVFPRQAGRAQVFTKG